MMPKKLDITLADVNEMFNEVGGAMMEIVAGSDHIQPAANCANKKITRDVCENRPAPTGTGGMYTTREDTD